MNYILRNVFVLQLILEHNKVFLTSECVAIVVCLFVVIVPILRIFKREYIHE